MSYRRWTAEEDAYLRSAWPRGDRVEEIDRIIGRGAAQIRRRASFLRLKRPGRLVSDARRRGGEQAGKLLAIDAKAIRRAVHVFGAAQSDVAKVYGVSPPTIHRIVHGSES